MDSLSGRGTITPEGSGVSLQAQEEEVKRQKAHEKAVEEQRMQEIERKKARCVVLRRPVKPHGLAAGMGIVVRCVCLLTCRDKELARIAEEEEKKRREIARRDAEIKAKLLAEAKVREGELGGRCYFIRV
jgi:hypothetical protein